MDFNSIINTENGLKNYVYEMNKHIGCNLRNLISRLKDIYPDIQNPEIDFKKTDKGALGKFVELCMFGNTPNNSSKPDLPNGYDVKVTKFKKLKNGNLNAKERLTITNVGNTNNYNTLNHLIECDELIHSKCFSKISKFVLLVFTNKKSINESEFLGAILFDFDTLPSEYKYQINMDFHNIREKIKNKNVSQQGQTYLHIHPHGSKKTKTRALGFKQKFITELFGKLHPSYTLCEKGKSVSVKVNDNLV